MNFAGDGQMEGWTDGQTDRHTILAPDISIEQLASE